MFRRLPRLVRVAPALALAAALLAPAAAAAPRHAGEPDWPWSFLRTLWTAVWGADGPVIDPDGAAPPPADGGPYIDPNG